MSDIIPLQLVKSEQRTANTRDRIITATVDLITEEGFGAASRRRIAERVGVSWGVVQQLFGSQQDMLEIILESSEAQFDRLMDTKELRQGSLSERVKMYIALSWRHYISDVALACMEILIATRSRSMESRYMRTGAHLQRMREIFPEAAHLTDREFLDVLSTTDCSLIGLAVQAVRHPGIRNLGGYQRRFSHVLETMLLEPGQ